MKIVLCEPNKEARIVEISETLDTYQGIVGGLIQAVYPFDDPVALICNDEDKLMGLPVNRSLRDDKENVYDILVGTFFICGIGENDFCSLTDELAEEYRKKFRWPEYFVRDSADRIVGVRYDPDDKESKNNGD